MGYVCACCAYPCERMQRLPSITVRLVLSGQGSLHLVLMFFISHPPVSVSPSTGVAGAQETTPILLYRCWDSNPGPYGCAANFLLSGDVSVAPQTHL